MVLPSEPGIVFVEPSDCRVSQSGISVIRSRGMLTTVALDRSPATWNSSVVSACPVTLSRLPYASLPSPVRTSLPMTRMLAGPSPRTVALPTSPMSTVSMFPPRRSHQ